MSCDQSAPPNWPLNVVLSAQTVLTDAWRVVLLFVTHVIVTLIARRKVTTRLIMKEFDGAPALLIFSPPALLRSFLLRIPPPSLPMCAQPQAVP